MEAPEAFLLVSDAKDFDSLNQFCFKRNIQYIDVQVIGYSGVATFGDSQVVLQWARDEGLFMFYYPLVNPIATTSPAPSLDSSLCCSSSPSSNTGNVYMRMSGPGRPVCHACRSIMKRETAIKCMCKHYVCLSCARQLLTISSLQSPCMLQSRERCQRCRPMSRQ